jgi:hypothetical protein
MFRFSSLVFVHGMFPEHRIVEDVTSTRGAEIGEKDSILVLHKVPLPFCGLLVAAWQLTDPRQTINLSSINPLLERQDYGAVEHGIVDCQRDNS